MLAVFCPRILHVTKEDFGPKRVDVTGDWMRLPNEHSRYLYASPNVIRVIKSRRMQYARHVAYMRDQRNEHRLLVGKPKGKRPLGRPRHIWEDHIKMDLKEI
jgi:hypothetical protein